MALTLDSNLATAQNSTSRRPLVEILSNKAYPDIPFYGQRFSASDNDDRFPSALQHSSGRMVVIMNRPDGYSGDICMVYSNTEQTEWFEATLSTERSQTIYGISTVEMTNGNILVIWLGYYSSYWRVYSMIVSATGTVIDDRAEEFSLIYSSGTITAPRVFLNGTTYTMFYAQQESTGETWAFYQRTSTDGRTWGSASALSIGGLVNTNAIQAGSILVAASGNITFLFEYGTGGDNPLFNIYQTVSLDGGSTWSTASAVTSYDEPSAIGQYPTIDEKSDEDIRISYVEKKNVLTISNTNPEDYSSAASKGTPRVHYDAVNEKLICISHAPNIIQPLFYVTVIDVPTWTIEKVYDYGSDPAFPAKYSELGCTLNTQWNSGHLVASRAGGGRAWVLDHVADTIRHFHFTDWVEHNFVKNVNYGEIDFDGDGGSIAFTWVDATRNRLYMFLDISPTFSVRFHWGYIDLSEPPDLNGEYTWHDLIEQWRPDGFGAYEWQALVKFSNLCFCEPGDGYIYFMMGYEPQNYLGTIMKYNATTFTLVEIIRQGVTYGDMPRWGIQRTCAYYDGIIYGVIDYESGYGEEDRRGIAAFNTVTGAWNMLRPTTPTVNNYYIYEIVSSGDGKLICASEAYGIYVYDITAGTWTLYDDETLYGFPFQEFQSPCGCDYDATTGTIFCSTWELNNSWRGVAAFNINGAFVLPKYIIGEIQGDDSYILGDANTLTISNTAADATIVIDSNDDMWGFWAQRDVQDYSVYWDKEASAINLYSYLVSGSDIEVSWSVADPAKLKFKIAQGHLFDPSNLLSLLAAGLRKGRLITLRFGEAVSGMEYWQNQGTFLVNETRLQYSRGDYPVIEVSCENLLGLLKEGIVISTEYYSSLSPETVVADIAEDLANIPLADISVPTLSTSHSIWTQFLDKTVMEMFEELGDHFFFFVKMTVDNDFTVVEFDFDKSPDHTYSDLVSMIDFSPDDTYSNYVNQVTVIGEARGFIEVIYDYELVDRLNGTMGWWGEDKNKTVYFSRDGERECVNPKLNVIQSVREFEIFSIKGGGDESIASVDPYDKYCIVYIEGPNLVGVFIAAVAALIAAGAAAIYCDESWMCGFFVFLTSTMSSIVINILGAVANYDYEIWAQPVGKEKLTIQAIANDVPFQQEIGRIVNDVIEDPLCYTVGQCQTVAQQEIKLLQLQRQRIKFSKTAHLQDEVGDIISLPHPYSGQAIKTYVTELKRIMTIPERGNSGGKFIDSIEGWRI
jgi:hypothetical protein